MAVRWARVAEFIPIAALVLGLVITGVQIRSVKVYSTFNDYPAYERTDWGPIATASGSIGLLALCIWTVTPVLMRPLTFPGRTRQQRFAVCSLLAASGIAWSLWLMPPLIGWPDEVSGIGVLMTLGLVAFGLYLRLGWTAALPESSPNR